MASLDQAMRFLVDYARRPLDRLVSSFGYDVYLVNVVRAFRREILGIQNADYRDAGREVESLSRDFRDAAWELCRRGIFRPGVGHIDGQVTDDGSGGNGYSVTAAGCAWLAERSESVFIVTEPSRFTQIVAPFRTRLGEGYFQRAQEAARCHFAAAHLACCVMCGAAVESIVLRVAIAKTGDEPTVLRTYRTAQGRGRVENLIVGQLRPQLAEQFRSPMELLKYWRDEAAHGQVSEIQEFHAYDALSRLIRLSIFVDDHWDELTAP